METKTKQSEYKLLCSLIPHACLFHNENKLSIKTNTRQSMYKLLCNLKPHHQLFHKRKQTLNQNKHSSIHVRISPDATSWLKALSDERLEHITHGAQ